MKFFIFSRSESRRQKQAACQFIRYTLWDFTKLLDEGFHSHYSNFSQDFDYERIAGFKFSWELNGNDSMSSERSKTFRRTLIIELRVMTRHITSVNKLFHAAFNVGLNKINDFFHATFNG